MPIQQKLATLEGRIRGLVEQLYGSRAADALRDILALARRYAPDLPEQPRLTWDQRDVVLITYGDQVWTAGEPPLATLQSVLVTTGVAPLIRTLHILPFFPFSSDDGFSVIDFQSVDPELGEWEHIEELGTEYDLMFDLVLNHVSGMSPWLDGYKAGREPYAHYFIEIDPAADLSGVVRPRTSPLRTPVETERGQRHLWTTFSDDQFDLNYAEPAVLVEMLDVLLFYLQQGARIVRLDAIAYLWKELGTPCIHHPNTHAVVKLLRAMVDALSPGTILLTETNVPQQENASYFGQGDEAQMVYQFSLAPLLLDALAFGDAGPLNAWLQTLEPPPPGCTVLNFTASHDGVGVRPLEGLVTPDRLARLVDYVRERGGQVSSRQNADGSESPYELNISYFSALADPAGDPAASVARFLASQALMLAMQGMPAVYFHSLFGTPNHQEGVEQTGRARSINRRKYERAELEGVLADRHSPQALVLEGYRRLLVTRTAQSAFHPDTPQCALDLGSPAVTGWLRLGREGREKVLVLGNVTPEPQTIDVQRLVGGTVQADLLGSKLADASGATVVLAPYQVGWFKYKGPDGRGK